MKTKFKKSPALYVSLVSLSLALLIGVGYLAIDAVTELINKRRLINGVQIVATVTDRKSHFNIIRGGGGASYELDYEFQYTDRQTGDLQKQVRTSYPVYKNEYAVYQPGSTFTASFIPSEPRVNEPSTTVRRLSPQSVLLVRLIAGVAFFGVITGLMLRFPQILERIPRSRKVVIVAIALFGTFLIGLVVGKSIIPLIERLWLK